MLKTDLAVLVQRVRELMHYNPDTGVFTRRVTRGGAVAGSVAGNILKTNGYWYIRIDGRKHFAHRLAWLYTHGVWPANETDHINGVRNDNRLCNLREATKSFNQQNQRKPRADNTSGYLGVAWFKKNHKWRAQINAGGIVRHIGYFHTPEEAHAAYVKAKRSLHPGNTL